MTNSELANIKLSEKTKSISGIAYSFIKDNASKLRPFRYLNDKQNAIIEEITLTIGHGIEIHKAKEVILNIKKKHSSFELMNYLKDLMLAGDGLKVTKHKSVVA